MDKRSALIGEGLTEAEADFLISGGQKTEGLDLPASDATPPPESTDAPPADPASDAVTGAETKEPEDDELPSSDGKIPYQRFSREKERRKEALAELEKTRSKAAELEAKYADINSKWTRLDERLKVFQEAAAPQEEKPVERGPMPDPEADPFGAIAWLKQELDSTKVATTQVTERTQEAESYGRLVQTYQNDAREFAAKTPDFANAYQFLLNQRAAELQAIGYSKDQINNLIVEDERSIVTRALETRRNDPNAPGPAELVYRAAKARGYAGVPAAPGTATGAPAAPATVTAPANPAATAAAKQLETIQRGQAAARSLSAGGGGAPKTALDLETIANMPEAEYMAWRKSLSREQMQELRGLMGG